MPKVLKIAVASPNDVREERALIPLIFDELNRGIAIDRDLRLETRMWETDTYPGFHPEGPQGQVEEGLRIDECDGLIGIFWTRFGTVISPGVSGTVHEIETARRCWPNSSHKFIVLYFSQRVIAPQAIDLQQLKMVRAFQDDVSKNALWFAYPDLQKFKELLRSHLTMHLRKYDLVRVAGLATQADQSQTELEKVRSLAASLIRAQWDMSPAAKSLIRPERKLAGACYQELRDLVKKSLTDPTSSQAGRAKALELVLRCTFDEDLVLALQNHRLWPRDLPELDEDAEDRLRNLSAFQGVNSGVRRWLFEKGMLDVQDLEADEIKEMLEILPVDNDRREELRGALAGVDAIKVIANMTSNGGYT